MAPDIESDARASEHPDESALATIEQLHFALAAAHMGVFDWDVNADVLKWSGPIGLGLNPGEVPLNVREFFAFVHPDDRQALTKATNDAIRDRTDVVTEFRIVSSDGVNHWVQSYGHIIYGDDGRPVRFVGVNNDITERKSLEDQLRKARRQVERLLMLKSTMRTVQDIVGNALMGLHLFRMEAEAHVSAESLDQFDSIINNAAARLKALGDLERVIEIEMSTGTGIDY